MISPEKDLDIGFDMTQGFTSDSADLLPKPKFKKHDRVRRTNWRQYPPETAWITEWSLRVELDSSLSSQYIIYVDDYSGYYIKDVPEDQLELREISSESELWLLELRGSGPDLF